MRKYLLASVTLVGISSAIDPAAYAQLSVQYGDGSGDDSGQGAPAPGSITVRLNGRFQFFTGYYNNNDMNDSYYYDVITGTANSKPFVIGPNGSAITGTVGAPASTSVVGTTITGAVIAPTTFVSTVGGVSTVVAVPPGTYRAAVLNNAKLQN